MMNLRVESGGGQYSQTDNWRNDYKETLKKKLKDISLIKSSIFKSDTVSLPISEGLRAEIKGMEKEINRIESVISASQTMEQALSKNLLILNNIELFLHQNFNFFTEKNAVHNQRNVQSFIEKLRYIARISTLNNKNILNNSFETKNKVLSGKHFELIQAIYCPKKTALKDTGYSVEITEVAQRFFVSLDWNWNDIVKDIDLIIFEESGRKTFHQIFVDDDIFNVLTRMNQQLKRESIPIFLEATKKKVIAWHNFYGSSYSFSFKLRKRGGKTLETRLGILGKDIVGNINGISGIGKGQCLMISQEIKEIGGLSIVYTGDSPEKGRIEVQQNALYFYFGNHVNDCSLSFFNLLPEFLGQKIDNRSHFTCLSEIKVETQQNINDSLLILKKARDEVRGFQNELSAAQKKVFKNELRQLQVARANIFAAQNTISDSVMAREYAYFIRQKIILQEKNNQNFNEKMPGIMGNASAKMLLKNGGYIPSIS